MATRFYLPTSGSAAVSPAYDSAWDDTSHVYGRLKGIVTKIGSSFLPRAITGDSDATDKDYLILQYVSDPIAAQTITAQTIKWQMKGAEDGSANNLYNTICIRVVSNDGSTFRTPDLLSLTRDDVELTTSETNRQFYATSSEVEASANDRIVIELGLGGDPTPSGDHNGHLRAGDNYGTDLPENDTETLDYCSWVEFANDVSFPSAGVTVTPAAATMVQGGLNPTVVYGSLNVTPAAATMVQAGVDPVVVYGSVTITPAAATMVQAGVDPTVDISGGGVTVEPAPATMVGAVVDPVVIYGSLLLTPAEATMVGATVNPSVIYGSLALTPNPATMIGTGVDPLVEYGSLLLTVAEATMVQSGVDPGVVLGTIVYTPSPATMVGTGVDPTVLDGGGVVITPAEATGVIESQPPTVIYGDVEITPAAATMVITVVNPTVIAGEEEAATRKVLFKKRKGKWVVL